MLIVIGASSHDKTWVNLPQREATTSCGTIDEYSSKGSQTLWEPNGESSSKGIQHFMRTNNESSSKGSQDLSLSSSLDAKLSSLY